ASLEGLTESTTYHYRIVATNPAGTNYGSDHALTTPPYPPAVLTQHASSVTATSATLNATVNPRGEEVSECEFEYGTTTSYGETVACSPSPGSGESPVAVSASLEGLTGGTTYQYRIVATNRVGTSYSSDEEFETEIQEGAVSGTV